MILAPLFILYGISTDERWLQASIMTISLFIVIERVSFAPAGVLLHSIAILGCFLALSYALPFAPLFILGCMALAAATVGVALLGEQFRSLGNFIFIPAVYLSCEAAELHIAALTLLPFLLVGIIAPFLLSFYDAKKTWFRRLLALRSRHHLGTPTEGYQELIESIIAVALACGIMAALVEWQNLGNGQWAIWSCVSVVTGDVATARLKLRHRMIGVLFGVPLGILSGMLLPHNTFFYTLASLMAILTLVSFHKYVIAFGTRCACIACAAWIAGKSTHIATERVVNVILGGVIGVMFVILIHWISKKFLATRIKEAQIATKASMERGGRAGK